MNKRLFEEIQEEEYMQDKIFMEEDKWEQEAEIEGLIRNREEFNIYTGKFNNKIKNKKHKFAERNRIKFPFGRI